MRRTDKDIANLRTSCEGSISTYTLRHLLAETETNIESNDNEESTKANIPRCLLSPNFALTHHQHHPEQSITSLIYVGRMPLPRSIPPPPPIISAAPRIPPTNPPLIRLRNWASNKLATLLDFIFLREIPYLRPIAPRILRPGFTWPYISLQPDKLAAKLSDTKIILSPVLRRCIGVLSASSAFRGTTAHGLAFHTRTSWRLCHSACS